MTDSAATERLERRLERERRARKEAEAIAETATSDLYESVQELKQSQASLAETVELMAIIERVAVAANEAKTLETAARTALDELCTYMGWPVGHLCVTTEPGRITPSTVWHLDDPARCQGFREVTESMQLVAGEGLPGRVLRSGKPAWIPDVLDDPNFPRAHQAVDIGVRAGFAFPVLVASEVVAVLEFFAFDPVEPKAQLLEMMANVGSQLARVVERTRAGEALRRSEEQTRLVIETANDAFVAIDASGRIIDWNRQAEKHFGWTRDEVLGRLLTETIIPPLHREAHAGGVAHFLSTGEGPVLGRRVELEGLHRDGHEFPIELTPWAVRDGDSYRFNAFIHDISERKAFERELSHQSLHDSLTGLPNRALFLDRLRHALTRDRDGDSRLAVLFIDLDRFKAVNDSLGHEAGDRLLIAVADRVPGVLRPHDTLARLGGDEFVVLCEHVADQRSAAEVADRIITCLEAPFIIDGSQVFISGSIGIALSDRHTASADELLADADLAMYRAKERGKGVHEVFDEHLRSRLVIRLATEKALRAGIEAGDLALHYQPMIALGTGTIVGVEALVRWNHPERGLLHPADFIPLAEDTGVIGRIGEWTVHTACEQLRRWHDEQPDLPKLWTSINLSVRELDQPRFVQTIVDALDSYGLEPSALVLEVTESMIMHDARTVLRRLWELHELGIRLALDDFGTGYSSLDRLRRMPVDTLKIDRSFISDIDRVPTGASLVAAIVAMSHSLGLGVVAEGVETASQLQLLGRLGCDVAQGYMLAKPAPADVLELLLRQRIVHTAEPLGESMPPALDVLESDLMQVVSKALTDTVRIERTARSLLAELQRLIGLELAESA